jgi:hypothetical protein
LVNKSGFAGMVRSVTAQCLSGEVAAAAACLPWQHVRIAATPTADALLALLPIQGARRG